MRKLRLEIDELRVETFPTAHDPQTVRGTVFGQATHVSPCVPTEYTRCWGFCGGASAPVLYCTYDDACMNTIACDTSMSVCEGRSCQLSCDSCNGTCYGDTCVGATCGNNETCVDRVCNYSVEPYCYG